MPKSNPMLDRIELKWKRHYEGIFHAKLDMLLQMGQDAAIIAANEVLGMGKGRATDFCATYIETFNTMAHMYKEDQDDDPEFVYSKAKIDERIRAIIGDDIFQPWDVRYGREKPEE